MAHALGARRRFVCRRLLGGRKGEGAAYLTPVPAGAVVYGTGEAAVILTKVCALGPWCLHRVLAGAEYR